MTIRYQTFPPTPAEYFTLFETTGWNADPQLTPTDLAKALVSSWYMISVYDDGRLIGFGRVVTDTIHAMIYDLIVAPDYQRQGIGGEILDRLVKRSQTARIRDIQLFCATGKREFYERHGFEVRPDDGPGMQYCKNGSSASP
ncbi:amino-acid N-acetyltransferase [Thermoflexales bacterium]|nr:amino-acid N-acetyltransferase [Thermoflexales bacterium]